MIMYCMLLVLFIFEVILVLNLDKETKRYKKALMDIASTDYDMNKSVSIAIKALNGIDE